METKTSSIAQQNSGNLPLRAAIFTIFLCSLFGANAVAIKISLGGIGFFTTVFIRFAVASIVLILWAKLQKIELRLNTTQLLQLALISTLFYIQMSGFYFGLNLTTASHGTLIANILPFVVMVLAHFFLQDDKITMRKICGLVLGFGGVVLLFFDSIQTTASSSLGDGIILMAIILWGCNVVIIKRIIDNYNPLQITVYPMLMTVPLFLVTALLFDTTMVSVVSPAILSALFYQAIVTASFGFIMWNTLIKRYGATALHSFIFIMPISGVFFGVVLLGEPLSASLLGSIFLVSLGLMVVNYQPRKASPKIIANT